MNVRSIAIVFDDRMRPDTTGIHCLRALEPHVNVAHLLPDQLSGVKVADFDLFIRIDDDQLFSWPSHLRPCACWLIDTFRDFELRLRHASEFDHVFLAQRTDVSSFRARIGGHVDWLPLGCNPSVHRRLPIDRDIDIGFVGNVVHADRERYLRAIAQHFPDSFIGNAFGDDLTAVYNKSRIGFNKSLVGDVNMRVFEVAGCGTLLLTDAVTESGLEKLFKIDQEIVTYADTHEMIDKSLFYIRNEASREHIAKRALVAAHQKHTYRHRMETIISAMEHRPSTFPLSLGSVQVPSICIESSIDILIKSFLRPAALLCLLQSIRQFYPNVSVTVLDDGNLSTSDDDASRVCLRYLFTD